MRLLKPSLILILLQLFSLYTLHAQPTIEKVYRFLENKREIDGVERLLNKIEMTFSNPIKRKIDGGHTQLVAEMESDGEYYSILLQQDKAGIYLAVINEVKPAEKGWIKRNTYFRVDSTRLLHFIAVHDGIYQSSNSIDQFRLFSFNRYGFACGSGGSPTPKNALMNSLISINDTGALKKWMTDFDYETKILGATGLLILQQQGIGIDSASLAIINHLKALALPINACMGCTFGDTIPSGSLLDDEWIKTVFLRKD